MHTFSVWTYLSNFEQLEHENGTKSVTNAWPWWEKPKATAFPPVKLAEFSRSESIEILIEWLMNTTFPRAFKKLELDHLKTSYLSADKKIRKHKREWSSSFSLGKQDESTPEPAIRSCDTDQHIPCFDSFRLATTWMWNIRLQAPILASLLFKENNIAWYIQEKWRRGEELLTVNFLKVAWWGFSALIPPMFEH